MVLKSACASETRGLLDETNCRAPSRDLDYSLCLGGGLRICISRDTLHLWVLSNHRLHSMLSFTSVNGACKGLIKHQMVGNFTMGTDEIGLGGNSL